MTKRRKARHRDLGLILIFLRIYRDLRQSEVADAAGVPASAVSEYECGKRSPRLKNLRRIVAALGFDLAVIEEARRFIERLRALEIRPSPEDRLAARDLFVRLERHPAPLRRALLREVAEFRSWALVEFVAQESSRVAAHDAAKAVELADLALALAEEIPGHAEWRLALRAYALAHLGNARRVAGNLRGAEQAFRAAEGLWPLGKPDPYGLLSGARMLGMFASLRREQRQPAESLDLLERALAADHDHSLVLTLLVNKATTLEVMGRIEEAIALLREIAPQIELGNDLRLLFCLRQNLLDFLSKAGRAAEAAPLLPEAKRLATGDLDRARVRWAEARITVSLGESARAVQLFSEVRGEFAAQHIGYDTALVSLELALLYLDMGRPRDVRSLARHMVPLFQSADVHRETLAALTIFRRAAEAERATRDLVQRIASFVYQARYTAGLRFEE